VTDADIRKYQTFSQTLHQARGFGGDFQFPDGSGAAAPSGTPATAAAAAADDDLYD
jgi:transitional endoplasmic reticulum ATPase